MAGSKLILIMVVALASMTQLQTTVAQTRHVVGGTLWWGVHPATEYATWASGQNFTVGDSLFFNFTTGFHDVTQVRETAFGPCTTTDPIFRNTTGPATVVLTTPGDHYYICTVGTHCQNGQKLSINVTGTVSTTPAPAGSTTPPPPPTSTMTPPSPSNASPSLTTVVPIMITFLVGSLAALVY